MLGREPPKLGRRTLLARLGAALERLLVGRLTDGRLTAARLLEERGLPHEPGRRTLLVREGFTRGWLTIVRLGLERGAVLVSVGPVPARPTTLDRDTVEEGGLCTTIVREGLVPRRLTESTRVLPVRVRVTVPVRALGARDTVPTRLGCAPGRATVPVLPYVAGGRRFTAGARPPPGIGRPTTPRVGRATVGRRGTLR